jgi:hypothetical protein
MVSNALEEPAGFVFYPEDKGSMFLENFDTCLLDYFASHPRGP